MNKKLYGVSILMSAAMLFSLNGCFFGSDDCHTNSDCGSGKVCVQGVCEQAPQSECNIDDDCRSGKVCENHKCVDYAGPDPKPDPGTDPGTEDLEYAQIAFKPVYGQYLTYFASMNWRALVPGKEGKSGQLVIMLCKEDDPQCTKPELVRAVTEEEGQDSAPVQASFGPQIYLYDLPAGTYNLMIFEDSVASAAAGRDWKTKNEYCEEDPAWGCVVSETDRMLVSEEDFEAYNSNSKKGEPGNYVQPSAVKVTIPEKCSSESCTVDLGTVHLAHYHEPQITENPKSESGYIVAGTTGGLRIIDLENHSVLNSYSDKMFDFTMVNDDGNVIDGSVCGIIDHGNNDIVWVIYDPNANSAYNFAVPFSVKQKKQIGTKHVTFVGTSSASACRGIVKDNKMYVMSRPDTRPATGNLFYATDLQPVLNDQENVNAFYDCDRTQTDNASCAKDDNGDLTRLEMIHYNNADSVAVWHDTVYTIQGDLDKDGKPKGSNGGICADSYGLCIFKSEATDRGLKAISTKDDPSTYLEGGSYQEKLVTENGEVTCRLSDYFFNIPAIKIIEKSDTEAWLIASKCLSVLAWKLTYNPSTKQITEEQMNLGTLPGQKGLDVSTYGNYITDWELSPDGKTLYGVPSAKSAFMFYLQAGTDESRRSESNRMQILALDVSGDKPVVSSKYQANIDNFEGNNNNKSNPVSPAIDPGIDMVMHWYHQYFLTLSDGLQGSVETFRPVGADIAVSNNTIWLITHSDAVYHRDLGHYKDIATYSIETGKSIFWPHINESYFHPYSASTLNDRPSGFPLDPINFQPVYTTGIFYMKK